MNKNIKHTTEILVYITKSGKFRARIKPMGVPAYEVTIGGFNWMDGLADELYDLIFNKIEKLHDRVTVEKNRLFKKNNYNGKLQIYSNG